MSILAEIARKEQVAAIRKVRLEVSAVTCIVAESLEFDVDTCVELVRRVNPRLEVVPVSARTGEGVDRWLEWLEELRAGG